MGNFNETAEKLMDKLSEIADNKTTANMLRLVNSVTMEVIAKVRLLPSRQPSHLAFTRLHSVQIFRLLLVWI